MSLSSHPSSSDNLATTSHQSAHRPAPARVLVTGAGGPAAIGFMRLADRPDVHMYAADMDPLAAGLYLVPPERRVILPRGDSPAFVTAVRGICRRLGITVIVPTVDSELLPLAEQCRDLEADGLTLVASPADALRQCLDKAQLASVCSAAGINVPATTVLSETTDIPVPSIVKPRSGSGSRGVVLVESAQQAAALPRDGSQIVQAVLPGEELSVDVFVRADGTVTAAVPRTRDKVDSGVAVAGRTIADAEAIDLATAVADVTGVRGVANVQVKRDHKGGLALLEVNPRLPGSLVLTAAAGANLAALALSEALGETTPDEVSFTEVAMVRLLEDITVPIQEYATLAKEQYAS